MAVLIVRNRHVLLAKRGVEPAKGRWDTIGGFVDEHESAEKAVARETDEETGLRVRDLEYLGSVPDVYGSGQIPILHLCYLAPIMEGEPVPRSDVASLCWFRIEELPETMAFPNQSSVLELLKDRLARTDPVPHALTSS